jgi:acyl-CoA synthetase (AMP-forming)/AMP-acid ligase II
MLAEQRMKYSKSKSFFFRWSNNTRKPIMMKNSVAYAIALLALIRGDEAEATPIPCNTDVPLNSGFRKSLKPLRIYLEPTEIEMMVAEEIV